MAPSATSSHEKPTSRTENAGRAQNSASMGRDYDTCAHPTLAGTDVLENSL